MKKRYNALCCVFAVLVMIGLTNCTSFKQLMDLQGIIVSSEGSVYMGESSVVTMDMGDSARKFTFNATSNPVENGWPVEVVCSDSSVASVTKSSSDASQFTINGLKSGWAEVTASCSIYEYTFVVYVTDKAKGITVEKLIFQREGRDSGAADSGTAGAITGTSGSSAGTSGATTGTSDSSATTGTSGLSAATDMRASMAGVWKDKSDPELGIYIESSGNAYPIFKSKRTGKFVYDGGSVVASISKSGEISCYDGMMNYSNGKITHSYETAVDKIYCSYEKTKDSVTKAVMLSPSDKPTITCTKTGTSGQKVVVKLSSKAVDENVSCTLYQGENIVFFGDGTDLQTEIVLENGANKLVLNAYGYKSGTNVESDPVTINATSAAASSSSTSTTDGSMVVPAEALCKDFTMANRYRTNEISPVATSFSSTVKNLRTSNPDSYLTEVAKVIKSKAANDFEKVKLAHDVICDNVAYDAFGLYVTNNVGPQDYASVLKRGNAVCEGYSNAFLELCSRIGITCVKVHGYARGAGFKSGTVDDMGENHAWNIVTVAGNKYLVDTTWDAGYVNGSSFTKRYTTDYLFANPWAFLHTHYPKSLDEQLLVKPYSVEQFKELPFFKMNFFNVVESYSKDIKSITKVGAKTVVTLKVKPGYSIITNLYGPDGTAVTNSYFKNYENGTLKFFVNFPSSGDYKFEMYASLDPRARHDGIGGISFKASTGTSDKFPEICTLDYNETHYLITPIQSPLKKGQSYTFTVMAGDTDSVALVSKDSKWNYMTKNADGTWSITYTVRSTEERLSVYYHGERDGKLSYWPIVHFKNFN